MLQVAYAFPGFYSRTPTCTQDTTGNIIIFQISADKMPYYQNCSCSPCHALSQVEKRLAEAKALVEHLTHEICRLKSTVNMAHDSLISRLPQELASRIFTFCISPFANQWLAPSRVPDRSDGSHSTVGTLTLVCSAWKNIAWSTPQLWNVFAIGLRSHQDASILHLTETYLKRSGALPLAIRIYMQEKEDLSQFPSAAFYPTFDSLNVHSHRWHTLALHIPFSLTSRLHGCPSSEAPRLQSLILRTIGRPSGPRSSLGFGSPNAQFRPSTVEMSGLYLKAVQIDWSHTTHVDVLSLSIDECLELLRLAPILQEFEIKSIIDGDTSSEAHSLPLTHYSLKKWDLHFKPSTSILCDCLTLPKLESLTIHGKGPYPSVEHLLQRSSCPLSYFALGNAGGGDDLGLIPLFRAMPHLEHFYLADLDAGDIPDLCALMASTAAFLADSDKTTLFLPRLETVEYFRCPNIPWVTIPSWFPPTEKKPNTLYRPLSTVIIYIYIPPVVMYDHAIDRNTIPGLMEVVHRGFDFMIKNIFYDDEEEESDFIEDSRQYHNFQEMSVH